MRLIVFLMFALAGAGWTSAALADRLPDEMLLFQEIPSVHGASRFEQKVTEAPSSVTIITAHEIKLYGYRTLGEILQSVRSFYITNDRNYTYLGARGFGRPGDYNARVLVLIDGHRINDSLYDGALIGTEFPLDIDLIEKVEIIRGPGSSLYGANALFAVINVITSRGKDLKAAQISGSAGSSNTYTARGTYGNRFRNGLDVIASGTYSSSKGQNLFFKEFNSPDTNLGFANNCDGDESSKFFSKLNYGDFSLQGVFSSREKHIPTAPFDTLFNDALTKTRDDQAYIDLQYEHSFENQLELMARASWDHRDYEGLYPYDAAIQGQPFLLAINKDIGRAEAFGGELQVSRRLFEKHKITVGTEYHANFRQDQINFDIGTDSYLDSREDSFNWGVYAQDEFRILSNLILNAGVRYDDFHSGGGVVNPRLALIYQPYDKTALKLIYGTAVRPPNVYELYYNDGTSIKPAKDLQPEKIQTYELIWEQYVGKHFWMTLGGFYYDIENLIDLATDTDGLMIYRNIGNVTAKGLEFELNGKMPSGIQGRLSYVLQQAEDDLGRTLTNSPVHQAKLNFSFPLVREKLFLSTQFIYMSSRDTLAQAKVDDMYVTNLTFFAPRVWKGLDLSASVYNLFDLDFFDPASAEHRQNALIQDGIAFRVKVTYSF